MCLYPIIINNKKYGKTKKNGGIIPAVYDERVLKVPVGCGKCIECKKQKARNWQIRLLQEVKHDKKGHFVTLTFSNEAITKLYEEDKNKYLEGYEKDNGAAKLAVRRFLERWRKEHKKSIKHWLITEIGHNGTENIHLHGIIWTDKPIEEIEKHWKYGWVWKPPNNKKTYISEQTVNYITKYITKTDIKHKAYNAKVLTSAGIGKKFLERTKENEYNGEKTKEYITTNTGHKIAMPVYYRNAIYSEEEREKLWIQKIEQKTRYVLGEKIDISKTEEQYWKALEYARKINSRLNYGTNEKEWSREKYEKEMRKINQVRRKV